MHSRGPDTSFNIHIDISISRVFLLVFGHKFRTPCTLQLIIIIPSVWCCHWNERRNKTSRSRISPRQSQAFVFPCFHKFVFLRKMIISHIRLNFYTFLKCSICLECVWCACQIRAAIGPAYQFPTNPVGEKTAKGGSNFLKLSFTIFQPLFSFWYSNFAIPGCFEQPAAI